MANIKISELTSLTPPAAADAPTAEKIMLTVRQVTGGFCNVSAIVNSVDSANITAQIFFTRITNGTLRVTAYAEA